MKQASDVIGNGLRRAKAIQMSKLGSLHKIANEMACLAQSYEHWAPEDSKLLYLWAGELRAHHDHADPCDDEACPCRKAEADEWRFHGAVRH